MKIVGLIILSILFAAFADEGFDRYDNLCFEDEKAHLDNFAINLEHDQESVGYIIVFAGRQACANEAKYRGERAKSWVVKRGIAPERVVVIDAGYRESVVTFLEIGPKGAEPPQHLGSVDKKQVSIHKCVDKVFARVLCPNRE